ncbi:cbb3-type cytochrome c oxidase subunit I [Longimicrobium sp.]|uniref:cbb3-type cytochrome c oxidase subunit I n=1 Tax=Longimicrobium sp. TaxID=2029185 RepID=UPI002E372BA5|nr:cbb3-type cytochrome c oxidase subunit I [Longimicrobium sp.]HEX6040006.1 cbb3-type cytochrome c oxidase subunit I [Longimicrobium sp.]
MDPFVRRFIRASLVWLGVGVVIGVMMALRPAWIAFRTAHMHANLLGFVSMMIFGVAYHVIPRFSGHPLHSRALASAHVWIANAGLAGMVSGFIVRVYVASAGAALLGTGALLSATGAFLFIYNVWRTMDAPRPLASTLPTLQSAPRPLTARS